METKTKKKTARWFDWDKYLDWCKQYEGKLAELRVSEPDTPYFYKNHHYYDKTISYPESATDEDKIICAYYAEKGMWLVYDIEQIQF